MADEIAQVVDLEYKGIYYLLKGTKEMIAVMAVAVKHLHEWNHEKFLDKPGSCSWSKIQEVSEGMAPILEFPKEMFEKSIDISSDPEVKGKGMITPFEYYCRKNSLRYCVMPDLNPYDDYIPVAVPAQDFGIHDEQIKAYMRKRVESEEEKDRSYEEKIEDAKEKLESAESSEDAEELKKMIESLEQGRNQNAELLNESKEKMEKGNVIDFADYIKQAEKTHLLDEPERSLYQARCSSLVREFMPEDCMYPIRDPGLVPESGELFYSQKAGDGESLLTVKRSFETEDNGLVYSVYEMTDPVTGAGRGIISDKGLSKDDWNKKLSEVLKNAGMMKDQPVSVTRSMENLHDYILSLDENFKPAPEAGLKVSPEAQIVIDRASVEAEKKASFLRSFYSTVTVPSERIMPSNNMILSLELDDGLVEGVTLVGMDSDSAKISIRSDAKYSYTDAEGAEKTLTGDEILKALDKKELSAAQTISRSKAGRL